MAYTLTVPQQTYRKPDEPLRLIWSRGEEVVGPSLYLPIAFSGQIGDPVTLQVSSNTHRRGTYETFSNIYLFLSGTQEQIEELGRTWPEQYDCGLQLSLDGGLSWVTFLSYQGVSIPDVGPFDKVSVTLRLKTPPVLPSPGLKEVFLDVDCDIR